MRMIALFALHFVSSLTASIFAAETGTQIDGPRFKAQIRPLLERHCFDCHGANRQEADLRLDGLNPDMAIGPDGETWHDVLNKLNLGEMPPKDRPRPPESEMRKIVGWLTAEMKRAAEVQRSTGGEVVLRRLNRYEYSNTMRELIGLELDYAKDLPPETASADGFQNNGSALGISPLQIEYYLKTARMAMSKAIVDGPQPDVFNHHAEESERSRRKKEPTGNRLPPGTRFLVRLKEYPTDGEIRVRVRAAAVMDDNADFPRMRVTVGVRSDVLAPEKTLGEADVTAAPDQPQTIEFRGRIEEFPLPGHNPKYPGVLITVYNVAANSTPANKNKKGKNAGVDTAQPLIEITSVDFTGPVFETWPPPSHTRILFESPTSKDETDYARQVLQRFMRRAYRRPVTDSEVDVMLRFFGEIRGRLPSFEAAIRETLAMVLISPEFLYIVESRGSGDHREPLTNDELASRLSYFLWSSMPDDALFAAATSGALSDNRELERQIRRMLKDPKSAQFVEHFVDQWLNLSGLDRVAVNPEYYPDFDDRLKADMRKETHLFFGELLRNDESALHLIDADFTMLNRPLARHYGLVGPRGHKFERVAVKPEDHRGGLLTQASILLSNSTGEDSHPIRRAVWLLDRLLDDPPPPPPPDVPELDSSEPDFASLPLKRQLELHRKKEACNNCHRRIDPWGIPFENFDAVGRWRSEVIRVVKKRRVAKTPVEADTLMPDGQEVSGIGELKTYLLESQSDRFANALVRKLLAYSLGRSLEWSDDETVESLTNAFAASDYRLGELIVAIARSEPFRTK